MSKSQCNGGVYKHAHAKDFLLSLIFVEAFYIVESIAMPFATDWSQSESAQTIQGMPGVASPPEQGSAVLWGFPVVNTQALHPLSYGSMF